MSLAKVRRLSTMRRGAAVEAIMTLHADYQSSAGRVTSVLSRPITPGPWAAVVVLHEWWGLDEHHREFTRRLAREGFVALAPDLYDGRVTSDWDEAPRLKVTLDVDRAIQQVLGAPAFLRSLPFVNGKVAVLGFCMGGGVALISICRRREYDAAVIYFHSISPDPAELANITCPFLGHYGKEDTITTVAEVERLAATLKAQGTEHEIYLYEQAGHAFVNEEHPEYYRQEAAEASWPRTLAFLRRHLLPGAAAQESR